MTIVRRFRVYAAIAIFGLPNSAAAEMPAFINDISAGTIAVISDGDFVAQTYATGRLAPPEAGYRDTLTILSLADGRVASSALPVSNSVTAPPEIMELAPDGLTAFVIERLGERSRGSEVISDLPSGRRLFAIDLTDKTNPRIAAATDIAELPEALAVSPDGRRVAVVANTPDASLVQIARYDEGSFGQIKSFDLSEYGIVGKGETPRGGVTATAVNWHPSGRFIAVNINTQNRVAFFELLETDGGLALKPWGNVVEVGRDPFVGRFTPDGGYYLTSDWGRDFTATTLEGRLPEQASSVSVIRLADLTATDAAVRHERIGGTATDVSAEGIAVSPDGLLIATINMRGTPLPPVSPRFDREASVTLLTFDPQNGDLTKVADYPVDGVLPEGGTFDLTGEHFLATVFQGHDQAASDAGAGLEVFRVVRGEPPALERLGRIPMPHGAHHVDVAR
ncbi:lactonase family protein [Nitratireductor sp. ZSWI3]|uniref:lactonase family protein n=1 Tax=Nitratireductor sp. ZSWI3 TaxID=2966359 RepID=UPI00214F98F9|nr:lactonase family protein [Nitratireductor sp. ZSWI3]MCR4265038.1 lactonase family protein [Nitratireductor sp. ZSWI3]